MCTKFEINIHTYIQSTHCLRPTKTKHRRATKAITSAATTKSVPRGKPTASKRMPAMVGPTKAPNANVDVQRPIKKIKIS